MLGPARDGIDEWSPRAAVGDAALGPLALASGLVFVYLALWFEEERLVPWQVLVAYENALLAGTNMVIWCLVLFRSRTLASEQMLYSDPLSVLGVTWT